MSEMNQLIGFLEEQLTVSEPTPDYTRHNQEVTTYIEYLKSMKQPQLNENQQILLDWLKDRYFKNHLMRCRLLSKYKSYKRLAIGLLIRRNRNETKITNKERTSESNN